MKKGLSFSAVALLFILLFSSCSDEGLLEGFPGLSDTQLKSETSGISDSYYWFFSPCASSGSIDFQNGPDGNFSVLWGNYLCFSAGKGWSSGPTTRIVGYNCHVYSQSGGSGLFGYHGWTRNPLMEYFVYEMWVTNRPTGTYLGTISSDGGTYNIYKNLRVNAPSIDGTQTYWQIFSTRTSNNTTGQNHTITFANHANAWAGFGYALGSGSSLAATLFIEVYGVSGGYINATVWDAGNSSMPGGDVTTDAK